ncbi:MAG: TIGR03790 family protein [Verrucomicrobiota bacterium]
MPPYRIFVFLVVALVPAAALSLRADAESDKVVVLVNRNEPDSRRIADYYVEKRGIPADNIIELETSTEETVSVAEYVETLHNPLLEALLEKEWINGVKAGGPDAYGRDRLSVAIHSIRYLVTTRGIPLRIENDPERMEAGPANLPEQFKVNRASVDSELSLLAGPPNLPMIAFVRNPLYNQRNPTGNDAARIIRVSRLDGPTAESVLRLIDRSLEAEATGLAGRAYFDAGGPHPKGDEWLRETADLARAAHFETDVETSKRPMDHRDRLDAPAIYMGWYRRNAYGPWREPRWSVPPGAIAYHLHSFSATTVRSDADAWLGAFVKQGYAATFGYVYEPYLEFTFRPQLFLASLLEGDTFGDAIAFSRPVLSWQGVAIGDPLYRPFKVGLEAQLAEGEGSYAVYGILREIQRRKSEDGPDEALAYAKSKFAEHPSLALAYRLAKLYEASGDPERGVKALKVVRYIGSFSDDEYVLAQRIADFLDKHGASELAFEVYEKLIAERGLQKPLRISLLEGGGKVAAHAGRTTEASRWPQEARGLKAPPPTEN